MKKPSEHIIHSLDFIKNSRRFKSKLLAVEVEEYLVELFGPVIKEYVTNVRIQNKILHLHLNSSTFKHQLYHEKEMLLERLHKKIGFVAFDDVQVHG